MLHRTSRTRRLGALVAAAVLAVPASATLASADTERRGPADGASTSDDSLFPRMGNGGYNTRHYRLDLSYSPGDPRLDGVATIDSLAEQALTTFTLDLAGLKVDSVRVDGHAARYTRHGHELRIEPVVPITDSDRFRTVVRYHGDPTTWTDPDGSSEGWFDTSDGATALNEPAGAMTWFPVNNRPDDTAFYDVEVDVPKGVEAVSNGELLFRRTTDGRTVWHWSMTRPEASHMVLLSIGQYRVFTSQMRNGPTLTSFTDTSLGRFTKARDALPGIIRFLSARLGSYPFADAGIVVDRVSAGYALETQTRPTFPGGLGLPTLAHEMAHQWVGGALVPADWSDIWLNEGFATYYEWLWHAQHGGPSVRSVVDDLYAAHPARSAWWDLAPAELTDPADLFADQVYSRGAMTLFALRERVGAADFATLMRRWVRQNKYENVTTRQFTSLAQSVSGQDLTSFFDAWLHAPSRPPRP